MDILQEKPARALTEILKSQNGYEDEEIYPSKLSSKISSTYSHTIHIITYLEKEGYLRKQKVGRKQQLELTQPGEDIAKQLQSIRSDIERLEGGEAA